MGVSNELIRELAKVTNNSNTRQNTESTVYGTVISQDDKVYVKVDGSESLTPATSTVSVKPGDRVTVMIKNHSANITGNITDPSAGSKVIGEIEAAAGSAVDKVNKVEESLSGELTDEERNNITDVLNDLKELAEGIDGLDNLNAAIKKLQEQYANLKHVNQETADSLNKDIEELESLLDTMGSHFSTEQLEATRGYIGQLKGYNADFTYVSAKKLSAVKAEIKELDAEKLNVKDADIKYALIDFANITEASVKKLFSESGIIKDLVMDDGHITGQLVGVTIIGDLIEGGTVKADKLVVLGEDGLYYKLNVNAETVESEQTEYNSLNGSIITAKSVTAEKIAVKDLVAFGATIGGFKITNNSIYSGVKKTADNNTRGIYLDNDGQVSFGDADNFLKYYRDQNGNYRLEISADSIIIGRTKQTVEETLNNLEIGAINLIRNSTTMEFEDYYFEEIEHENIEYLVDEDGNVLIDENDNLTIEQ